MKKKVLASFVAIGVLVASVSTAVVYLNTNNTGIDAGGASRTAAEVNEDIENDIIFLDDDIIPLSSASDTNSALRAEVYKAYNLVNEERESAGLDTLAWDDELVKSSSVRSQECSVSFSHTRPNGQSWNTVNSRIQGGENLAYGFYDAESATNAWMDSPTHRDNILYPEFEKVAISIYEADDGTYYWAQEFGY